MKPATILVVDDQANMRRYLRTLLESDSYAVDLAADGTEALGHLEGGSLPDLVLMDVRMPGLDGLEALARVRGAHPELKVVMLSGDIEPPTIARALHLGAADYLRKPFRKPELDVILARWLPRADRPAETPFPIELEDLGDDVFFLAACPAMRELRGRAAQIAAADVPVLLLGESGTGKEVAARLIHKLSPRSRRPFLKVNCAALPSDLLESELFGYEPGAFTGAVRAKPGKFEMANKGTILLDEIGEMSPDLQAKLLHVLQDHEFARLGGRSTIKVDVRILAATNINIKEAIAERRLRSDLYYRLNAFVIKLPPLRERRDEIPFLLRHLFERLAARYGGQPTPPSARMLEACLAHDWPGNLRELENFVKRCIVLRNEEQVIAELLELLPKSERVLAAAAGAGVAAEASGTPRDLKTLVRGLKDEAEMEAIARALEQTKGIRREAARLLNISSKALLYKIRQYGLDRR